MHIFPKECVSWLGIINIYRGTEMDNYYRTAGRESWMPVRSGGPLRFFLTDVLFSINHNVKGTLDVVTDCSNSEKLYLFWKHHCNQNKI